MRAPPPWLVLLPFGLTFALGTWALPRQPSRVPVHWEPDGQPDRYGTPAEGLLGMPGVLLLVSLIFLAVSRTQRSSAPLMHAVVLGMGLLGLGSAAAQAFGGDSFRSGMIGPGFLFILSGPALGRAAPESLTGPRLSPVNPAPSGRRVDRLWRGGGPGECVCPAGRVDHRRCPDWPGRHHTLRSAGSVAGPSGCRVLSQPGAPLPELVRPLPTRT